MIQTLINYEAFTNDSYIGWENIAKIMNPTSIGEKMTNEKYVPPGSICCQ